MRIARVHLRRAPRIPRGFEVGALDPGLNVVLGRNESGKTTLARAVRAALWREEAFEGEVDVEWDAQRGALASRRAGPHGPTWTSAGADVAPPALPPAHLRGSFFLGLEDLLAGGDGTRGAIASMLRKELAGGYELGREKLLASWRGVTLTPLKKQHEVVREARDALAKVRARHAELAVEEARLEEVVRERDAARAAREELARIRKSKQHAALARELVASRAKCAQFPGGMERVPRDVEKQFAELTQALGDAQSTLDEALRDRREVERELEELAPLVRARASGSSELDALPERGRALEALDRSLDELERQLDAARSRVAAAAGIERARSEALDAAALARLEALARSRAELDAACAAARAEHEALDDDEVAPDPKALDAAAARLGAWIGARASSEADGARRPWRIAGLAAAAAGALALAGFALAAWIALAAGVALVAYSFVPRSDRATSAPRLSDLGLDELDEATPAAAARRLQELAAMRERAERARRRGELARRLERLESDRRVSAEERAREVSQLGLDARWGELELAVLAERVRRVEEATSETAALEARMRGVRARFDSELALVRSALRSVEREEPRDARAALAAIEALEKDRRRVASARERLAGIAKRTETAERHLGARRNARAELFHAMGLEPDDLAGLRLRAARHSEWRAACDARDKLQSALELLAQDVGAEDELLVLGELELERRERETSERAEREHELSDEAAEIRRACEAAREGGDLARALADVDASRDDLEERRRELLRGRLADFLVASVEDEHRRTARPELVERAAHSFARATGARYELELADANGDELPLRVREGERAVELRHLSAGTRAQLGIALRVAAAEQAEADESLPLFLDEVLANSDPERFAALVLFAAELAREGRQVVYLTADPDEVQRMSEVLARRGDPPPRVVELDGLRREAAAGPALPPRVPPGVPAPEGETAESYLAKVGASAMDAYADFGALHLGHLLFDELDALYRMLCDGAETVGRARRLLDRGWTKAWDARMQACFELRAGAARAFLDAWRAGRGKPLDEATLRASNAVSKTYADALVAVAAREDWDASRLMDVVRERGDAGLKGFRENKARELEEELTALGHLDPRERLDEVGCLERVAGALEPELRAGSASLEELRAWVARWWGAVSAPKERG